MAFSNLEKAMAAVIGLDIARPGFSRAAAKQAVRAIGTVTLGAGRAAAPLAPTVSQIGAAPVALGAATGLGILASPEGQELLAAAEQKGREDRVRFEQFLTDVTEPPKRRAGAAKRKVSKYSKAVKAGMAAVKASKFGGKKGTLSNAKTAFATVNKVASAVNKGKKVASKGIRGVAARAIRKVL